MKLLETSFLVDYLNEQPYTIEYLEANAQAEYAISTITLYEVYAGAIRSTASGETIETITDAIAWADVVAFDESAAREAADIRAALLDRGSSIPAPDILNTGVARSLGCELIATDEHFAEIPQLNTHNPRDSHS
ncbi:tRNA(fMet)-specific endonuclease VapC [Halalkalicoccus paucihalophilus]|uniref:tRNA(FMet)-specific endonuclease VapC n=1 Tax=Halalkalicoccus paucihalophilus TaxID=1008153 RepID=A0A151A8A5_9EURY|nr:PIN domain-containing protein [Halalkalicoccus paucihalophilus]KYH23865.1 tRNA(fMet)-specific endonuclease VapC [Halalkalicoccus paucihalophilus]